MTFLIRTGEDSVEQVRLVSRYYVLDGYLYLYRGDHLNRVYKKWSSFTILRGEEE